MPWCSAVRAPSTACPLVSRWGGWLIAVAGWWGGRQWWRSHSWDGASLEHHWRRPLLYPWPESEGGEEREREREMSTTLVYKWQIATYSSSFLWVEGSTRSWTTTCTKQPGYCNATTGLQCAPNSLVIAMPLLDYNMHQTAWLLQCHYYTENCNSCRTRSGRL